jgi:hypothetical protein
LSQDPQKPQKPAFGPAARILAVLALAHLPWPKLGPLYASYVGHVVGWLVSPWAVPTLHLRLSAAAPSGPAWSLLLQAWDTRTHQEVSALLDVRRAGWLSLSVFLALLLAFPVVRWHRRLLLGGTGIAALHALSVLPVLDYLGGAETGFFELGAVTHTLVVVAQRALLTPPGMAYAGPALLWFLLAWKLEPELM